MIAMDCLLGGLEEVYCTALNQFSPTKTVNAMYIS